MFLKNPWVVDTARAKPLETERQASKRRKREMEERWEKMVQDRISRQDRVIELPQLSEKAKQYQRDLAHAQDVLRSDKFKAWYEKTTGKPVEPWRKRFLISDHEHLKGRLSPDGGSLLDWIYDSVRFVADSHPYSNPYLQDQWEEKLQFVRGPERRQILIQLATPKWVNWPRDIKPFYAQAAKLYEETGIPHDVDHIVPITHPLVCGLNVPANLQVITAGENRKKSNKFQVG